jgi:hypothetical protein
MWIPEVSQGDRLQPRTWASCPTPVLAPGVASVWIPSALDEVIQSIDNGKDWKAVYLPWLLTLRSLLYLRADTEESEHPADRQIKPAHRLLHPLTLPPPHPIKQSPPSLPRPQLQETAPS